MNHFHELYKLHQREIVLIKRCNLYEKQYEMFNINDIHDNIYDNVWKTFVYVRDKKMKIYSEIENIQTQIELYKLNGYIYPNN